MNLRGENTKDLVRWLQIVVLTTIFLVFVYIFFGFADPAPVSEPLDYQFDDPAECEQFLPVLLAENGTMQLSFRLDQPYSVQIGEPDRPGFDLLLDPTGYVQLADADGVIRPLATFPHVDRDVNEVWIDWIDHTAVSIRINREIYWQGEIDLTSRYLHLLCGS